MTACVIMHNMIVEDEGYLVDPNERFDNGGQNVQPGNGRGERIEMPKRRGELGFSKNLSNL